MNIKRKVQYLPSLEVLYKTEELLDAASNRYRITVQVANKAKRKRYEDINLVDDFKLKPVIRAILEIAEEINRPEILND
jgi:DNA-directed RNA polymerase subunit omega